MSLGIFDDISSGRKVVSMSYEQSALLNYGENRIAEEIVKKLSDKIVEDIYGLHYVAIDMESLTAQVTVRLAKQIAKDAVGEENEA